jgi:hypothetical protein
VYVFRASTWGVGKCNKVIGKELKICCVRGRDIIPSMIPDVKTQHNSNVAENKITIKDMQQNNNHHDMNFSNHSRQETCNNPYNSRT